MAKVSQADRVLDYRSPAATSARAQRVMNELAGSERRGAAAVVTKLVIGLPLTLIAPVFITLICIAGRLRAGYPTSVATCLMMFAVVTVVIVSLLMWYERHTEGQHFADSMRGEVAGPYVSPESTWAGYVEVALTGPRLLWEAIDATAGRAPVDDGLRATAADIVIELLDAGEGKPVRQLVRPDRPAALVQRAVDYLLRRQWLGMSSRKDRVWLASDVRERLARR